MSDRKCRGCGAELPEDAPEGLCPKCLLKAGFQSELGDAGTADTVKDRAGNIARINRG